MAKGLSFRAYAIAILAPTGWDSESYHQVNSLMRSLTVAYGQSRRGSMLAHRIFHQPLSFYLKCRDSYHRYNRKI
ncbi:hypothetical protein [Moorena bouillonii]|uniref:hypothetical protein n=1 Tax=Moorena bouillonii TaxID=207920 RepID=UPI00117C29FF|nr:hypothetical protein [Moorena bouillonii]